MHSKIFQYALRKKKHFLFGKFNCIGNQMLVGVGISKLNKREIFFVHSWILLYMCSYLFIYIGSPDDDISKTSKNQVQAILRSFFLRKSEGKVS